MTTENKKYIYSINLANTFMELGYRCYGTGFNAKSGKNYWIFDYLEVQPYYEMRDKELNR